MNYQQFDLKKLSPLSWLAIGVVFWLFALVVVCLVPVWYPVYIYQIFRDERKKKAECEMITHWYRQLENVN